MSELKRRYPLDWPRGWKRTKTRVHAQFGKVSGDGGSTSPRKRALSAWDGAQRVVQELSALGVREEDILISTNLRTRLDGMPRSDDPEPTDPGAVVYWQDKTGSQHCMPIDQYHRVADNLAAIAATLNALRAVKRHGGGAILDRTIEGLRPALPESVSLSWRQVLEFNRDQTVTVEMVERRHREMAKKFHSDLTGASHAHMAAINVARDEALAELAPKEMHA
jgi:hypothetical protein